MTEEAWLGAIDPQPMLEFLRGKVSDRKLRLFACACFRNVWKYITDANTRRGIEVVELFADGLASAQDLAEAEALPAAWGDVEDSDWQEAGPNPWNWNGLMDAMNLAQGVAGFTGGLAAKKAADTLRKATQPDLERMEKAWQEKTGLDHGFWGYPSQEALWLIQKSKHLQIDPTPREASILRHIVGNPFHSYAAPECWPPAVSELADALHHGEDCDFALHDALLEAEFPLLADHFCRETAHPNGCWVLDLLRGKE